MKRRQRDRNAARARHARRVRVEDLHPAQQAGFTVGANTEEAIRETWDEQQAPTGHKSGREEIAHQLGGEQKMLGRIPIFRALLKDDVNTVWRENDGRLQRNVVSQVEEETMRAIQAGHICLRCFEPQPEAFPDQCDMCGYPMHERQIMDVAMEFRGREHIGPGLPHAQWMAEQEEKAEREEFARAKREGRSPMNGLTKRILSPGAAKRRGVKAGEVRHAP